MSADKNPFGGGNKHGLYVPMTDDEQEVIHRTVESQTVHIVVHPWEIVCIPTKVGVGDKRVVVNFTINFTAPAELTEVAALDLELKAFGGVTLIRKPYPTILPNGTKLMIQDGMNLDLQWDIAIDHIDPNLVKAIKPGAHGLTSTRLDPVTGKRTLLGNMRFRDNHKKKLLQFLEAGEASVRNQDAAAIKKLLKGPR